MLLYFGERFGTLGQSFKFTGNEEHTGPGFRIVQLFHGRMRFDCAKSPMFRVAGNGHLLTFAGYSPGVVRAVYRLIGRKGDPAIPNDLNPDTQHDEGRQSHYCFGAGRSEAPDYNVCKAVRKVDRANDSEDAQNCRGSQQC